MFRQLTRAAAPLAGLLALAASSAALADGLTVQLQTVANRSAPVLAGGVIWTCQGATCTSSDEMDETLSVAACRELGKQVGAVSTYGAGRHALAPKELERCNVGLAAPATQTAKAEAPAGR